MHTRRSRRLIAALALIATAVTATVITGCTSQSGTGAAKQINTVTASGSGTVQAAPDEATMSFGVSKTGKDPKALLADVAKTSENIVAALKKAGIAEEDIQTQNVSLFPQTDYSRGKPVVTGYEASINVTAKVRDLATLGAVISAGNDAGATTMNGPTFDIAEDSPYTAKAIGKAVADARRNAEAMAKAADKSVGKVLSITDSTTSPVVPYAAGVGQTFDAAKSEAVPINPGQLDVNSDVVVTFELK